MKGNLVLHKDLALHYWVIKMGYSDNDTLMNIFRTRGGRWSFTMASRHAASSGRSPLETFLDGTSCPTLVTDFIVLSSILFPYGKSPDVDL